MGRHIRDAGDPIRAQKFFRKAQEIESRASRFQELATDHESLSGSDLEPSRD
jgi:hypothetical protein